MLFLLTALLYLAGTAGFAVYVIRRNEGAAKLARRLMMVGLAFHTAHLIAEWLGLGHVPAVNLSQSLSIFAWAIVAGYLLVQIKANVKVLGALAAPAALLLLILSLAGPAEPPATISVFRSAWLAFHVATAFLGDGILALAFMAGLMYLLQEREIKNKRFGWAYTRLPSLNTLDHLNHTCLVFGFALLTAGMLTGAVYGQLLSGLYWRWDAKEVWSLITWIVYAILLHQRLTVGWRGRRAAWMSIIGFAVVVFTFLGASLLLSGYHDFSTYGQQP